MATMIPSFFSAAFFGESNDAVNAATSSTATTSSSSPKAAGSSSSAKSGKSSASGAPNANHDPITKKTTDRGSIFRAGVTSFAFSGMQGWRATMEDAHVVCKAIPVAGHAEPLEGHSLFAVMDGHGGDYTSLYAAKHMIGTLSKASALRTYRSLPIEDQRDVPGIELLREALAQSFAALDADIRRQQNRRNDVFLAMAQQNDSPPIRFERSGSTCVVILVSPSHIICANAGDSRAVLRRGGKTLPLSFDHKPPNIPEQERIQQAGGFVKGRRVDGDLAVSRGLGDFLYKSNETKPVGLQKVIPNPEILVYPRSLEEDEFIVIACDGVWDVASNAQCADFISELVNEGESDLGLICEEALDVCLARNSRDNMTMGLIGFTGMKIATGLSKRNVVWQRRATRQAKAFEIQARLAATRAAVNVGLFSAPTKTKKPSQTASASAKRKP